MRRPFGASRRPGRTMLVIAALLVADRALLTGFTVWMFAAELDATTGATRGLVWLTQAARLALMLAAFRLWLGLAAEDLRSRAARIVIPLALLVLAYGRDGLGLAGFVALLFVFGGAKWPSKLTGWPRAGVLLVGPVLLLLLTLFPINLLTPDEPLSRIVATSTSWPPALLADRVPPVIATELALARPLDHALQALIDLFRAQLVILLLRTLTLPIRLSGMSLKRRFLVHSIFVRQIPSVLSLITLLISVYFAAGLQRAAELRAELERTVASERVAGRAILERPAAQRASALASVRGWLPPEDAGAWVVLRNAPLRSEADSAALLAARERARSAARLRFAAPAPESLRAPGHRDAPPPADSVVAALPGTPPALLRFSAPPSHDGSLEGIIGAGGRLYLACRTLSDSAGPRQALEVYVPLDSAWLAHRVPKLGARLSVRARSGVSMSARGVALNSDSSSSRIEASSGRTGMAPTDRRRLLLGRSLMPAGDWRSGWEAGRSGAIEAHLELSRSLARTWLREIPNWFVSNILMLFLVFATVGLIGVTEGMAVRSGRGIVQAIESEVSTLRDAATRFGAGDLDHRVPVRGRDEFSALSSAFNEMAASLQRQRAELAEKERLEEDIEVARGIQRRMLPQEKPRIAGLDVAGMSEPSREVGGDLYHWAEVGEGRLAIALGDVSGKSVPAALLMSNVMSGLRSEQLRETAIEESLARLNQLMVEQIEPGRFVTLFYGVLDPAAAKLRYTSAGHNAPLLLSADGEARWLAEGGVPLGVMPGSRYPVADVPFGSGDTLVVYSDGVSEAEGPGLSPESPELFGEDRLLEAVRRSRRGGAEAVVAAILDAVRAFGQGRPAADDITLVVVQPRAGGE